MASDGYDTTRDYQTILQLQIEEGLKELERPKHRQFLSSLTCGLTLGIGIFGLLMFTTVLRPQFGEGRCISSDPAPTRWGSSSP